MLQLMSKRKKSTSTSTSRPRALTEQTMLQNVFKVRHSLGQDHPHYASSLSKMDSDLSGGRTPPPKNPLPDMETKDVNHKRSQKIQGWESIGETHLPTIRSAYSSLVDQRRQHKDDLERRLMGGQATPRDYRDNIKEKTITPESMVAHLNTHRQKSEPEWSTVFDEQNRFTSLKRGETEVGRFLHGENAFEQQQSTGTEREVFRKKWGGLRDDEGSRKEFVQDDFGNFTRRIAHRIDTEDFFGKIMNENQTFTGKHFRNRKTEGGHTPDFLEVSPFEAQLSGKISSQRTRTLESTAKGKSTVLDGEMVNDNAALFYHQFLGNNDSQRGASLTSTPRGIVGNAGEGFGVKKGGQDRVKFTLDLAQVPKRKVGEEPNLFNYNASAMGSKGLDRTGLETGRRRSYSYTSSVTKNREVFLNKVTKSLVTGREAMKPLDTRKK